MPDGFASTVQNDLAQFRQQLAAESARVAALEIENRDMHALVRASYARLLGMIESGQVDQARDVLRALAEAPSIGVQ